MASTKARDEVKAQPPEQFRGWLFKWTNYIKGYQKRWFVISNGLLSYYRTQEEMAHTCRGTINLVGSAITTMDSTHFVVTNGASQAFYLRALNEIERQRWMTALELAKATAINNLEDIDDDPSDTEEVVPFSTLADKLHDLTKTYDLIKGKYRELIHAISVSENETGKSKSSLPNLKEKTAVFKVTADALIKLAEEFVVVAGDSEKCWTKTVQHERKLRVDLEVNFEALATEMHGLENQARRATRTGMVGEIKDLEDCQPLVSPQPQLTDSPGEEEDRVVADTPSPTPNLHPTVENFPYDGQGPQPHSPAMSDHSDEPVIPTNENGEKEEEDDDDDDKFFDAPVEAPESVKPFPPHRISSDLSISSKDSMSSVSNMVTPSASVGSIPPENLPANIRMNCPARPSASFFEDVRPTIKERRTSISRRPNSRLNLWNILKNCIGRDLTKIPMPVQFSEPLSFLQRIAEELFYSDILAKAAACESSLEQAGYVAAFACSHFEATAYRLNKPFNPMLGETYECDRRAELGWRCLFEQVSHHPPALAMIAEHKEWTLWQEYTVGSKFRGNYLQCSPIGCLHLVFHRTGNHYTWTKVVITIRNLVVGKPWVDNAGDMNIVNHTTNEKCLMKYRAYSYFSRERQRKVSGKVIDTSGNPVAVLNGYWDEYLECAPVLSTDGHNIIPGQCKRLWQVQHPPPGSELIYHFSPFTCSLNEMEEGVAPTDSRFRPDQRIMEQGDFDEANRVKVLLEEKQRARRRKREALQAEAAVLAAAGNHEEAARLEKEATYTPVWFKKEYDPLSNSMMHVYKGGYWEQKKTGSWESVGLTNIFET